MPSNHDVDARRIPRHDLGVAHHAPEKVAGSGVDQAGVELLLVPPTADVVARRTPRRHLDAANKALQPDAYLDEAGELVGARRKYIQSGCSTRERRSAVDGQGRGGHGRTGRMRKSRLRQRQKFPVSVRKWALGNPAEFVCPLDAYDVLGHAVGDRRHALGDRRAVCVTARQDLLHMRYEQRLRLPISVRELARAELAEAAQTMSAQDGPVAAGLGLLRDRGPGNNRFGRRKFRPP